jgi:hypothetical protein
MARMESQCWNSPFCRFKPEPHHIEALPSTRLAEDSRPNIVPPDSSKLTSRTYRSAFAREGQPGLEEVSKGCNVVPSDRGKRCVSTTCWK